MKKIMLQFAMDGADKRNLEDALSMIDSVVDQMDILEVGTSYILRYGMDAVRRFKEAYPGKLILADMKIMDGGYHHAAMGCRAGADIVTILGVSDETTIRNAVRAAHENDKEIMVDLICVSDKEAVITRCEELGADYICVHAGVDAQAQGADPYADLEIVKQLAKSCRVAVAGGIDEHTVGEICQLGPDIVIVGSAIHSSPNCIQAAKEIREQMDGSLKER